jgi:hypothetical protein
MRLRGSWLDAARSKRLIRSFKTNTWLIGLAKWAARLSGPNSSVYDLSRSNKGFVSWNAPKAHAAQPDLLHGIAERFCEEWRFR